MIAGVLLGLSFAFLFHLTFVGVGHGAEALLESYGVSAIESAEDPFGSNRRRISLPAGPAEGSVLPWMEPFWAALSASLGQCLAVAVWAWPDSPIRSPRDRRVRRRRRYAVAHALMWLGVAAMVFGKLAHMYTGLVFDGSMWESVRRAPLVDNPFSVLGPASVLAVLFLALIPWQGLSLSYRCRWWPALGVVTIVSVGGVLLFTGRWAFVGAA